MSRLKTKFDALSNLSRKALIPFITAGDPSSELTLSLMHKMVTAGADIIELGVPFSDPMADGPVIQRANERALKHKMNLKRVLEVVEAFRAQDSQTPVVLMGYLNPIESMGYSEFVRTAKKVGVDGVLTVDMPPEEASEMVALLDRAGVDPIFLLAPNSTEARIKKAGAIGKGYIYYVSLKGVTGASHLELDNIQLKLDQIQRCINLPVAVGFGVKTAETAAAIAKMADAVVVGSALISKIETLTNSPDEVTKEIFELLHSMRLAMDVRDS